MILGGKLPGKVGRCRFFRPHGQAVKTSPFHGGNPGSIPGGVTKSFKKGIRILVIPFLQSVDMRDWRNWQTH